MGTVASYHEIIDLGRQYSPPGGRKKQSDSGLGELKFSKFKQHTNAAVNNYQTAKFRRFTESVACN